MKKYLFQSIRLTLTLLVLLCVIYPVTVAFVARFSPGKGNGEAVIAEGRKVGYANIGQTFSRPDYFWGRPSAVGYNAGGSGGSNKGASNPDYLKDVENRIDTLLKYHQGASRNDIPVDLITASGSGLDPDITVEAARFQIARVAKARQISQEQLEELIDDATTGPVLSLFGPSRVNVLQLNISLDKLQKTH
ncbi:potassium-transporting ATPase subunit KdpC [Arcticibacter sp. MXS-1]|uniref:potassium-transporting ATPase subunit KdpC n=1 Tax=Arcticibacter sp. MXS-1 TaxID=3341726 RepID=UPI0035A99731